MTNDPLSPRSRRWTSLIDGNHLRNARRQHGLTRDQLARNAGISPATIARLERHTRTACRSRTLARLATALGKQPADLTPEPDLSPSDPLRPL